MTREQIIKEASKHIAKNQFPADDRKIQVPVQDIDDPLGFFYMVTFEKKRYREVNTKGHVTEWHKWEVYSISK